MLSNRSSQCDFIDSKLRVLLENRKSFCHQIRYDYWPDFSWDDVPQIFGGFDEIAAVVLRLKSPLPAHDRIA